MAICSLCNGLVWSFGACFSGSFLALPVPSPNALLVSIGLHKMHVWPKFFLPITISSIEREGELTVKPLFIFITAAPASFTFGRGEKGLGEATRKPGTNSAACTKQPDRCGFFCRNHGSVWARRGWMRSMKLWIFLGSSCKVRGSLNFLIWN